MEKGCDEDATTIVNWPLKAPSAGGKSFLSCPAMEPRSMPTSWRGCHCPEKGLPSGGEELKARQGLASLCTALPRPDHCFCLPDANCSSRSSWKRQVSWSSFFLVRPRGPDPSQVGESLALAHSIEGKTGGSGTA